MNKVVIKNNTLNLVSEERNRLRREYILMPLALNVDVNDSSDIEKYQLKYFLERCSGMAFLDVNNAKDMAIRNRFSIEVCKQKISTSQKISVIKLAILCIEVSESEFKNKYRC